MGSTAGYELPMTQEQLADASGLTAVHVNRTLKSLANDGLIRREKRFVFIPDWEKLRAVAGFTETLPPPRSGRCLIPHAGSSLASSSRPSCSRCR